jgi:hypothetical protein
VRGIGWAHAQLSAAVQPCPSAVVVLRARITSLSSPGSTGRSGICRPEVLDCPVKQ